MKIKNIYYIGAALLLAGCSNETELTKSDTLSGGEKTPLTIAASLGTGNGLTRAAGNDFAEGDQLLAYIRHINNTNASAITDYTSITADQAPRLVTFTKGSADMADADANDNIKETTNLTVSYTSTGSSNVTALYWDDFSQSDDTPSDGYGDKDLRTANHGLQSYYGYCYNGGTPTTTLVPETGELGWTVQTDQTVKDANNVATNFLHSDLLWSPAQTAVNYAHTDSRTGAHGTLTIPYTHAMSEMTVIVIAKSEDGFKSGNQLADTKLTLKSMNTVATLTAPTAEYTSGTAADIKMLPGAYTSGTTRTYTAIIAPGTKLKVDNHLLDIVDVEDNDYKVYVTGAMLTSDAWADNPSTAATEGPLTDTDDKSYINTLPGVNYQLTVTVQKAQVDTKATLANWFTLPATGTGVIQLDENADDNASITVDDSGINSTTPHYVNITSIDDKFQNTSDFTLYWAKSETANALAAEAPDSYTYATISAFDKSNDVWNNTPTLYWPNANDNYYFRALAKYKGKDSNDNILIEDVGESVVTDVSQGTIADGHDIIWGTTALHKGKNDKEYKAGQAIPPRVGGVPIAFDHAMSKISVNLATTNSDTPTAYNSNVSLSGATIAISNLYISGTIATKDGIITPASSVTADAISNQAAPLSEYIVIPQTISDDAIMTITLSDGTTYKKQLNTCKDSSNAAITSWVRGTHYTYTITLEKEKITFRVLIKDWEEKTGSGNANLEWD